MNTYTPPYKINSKILKLSTQISEELTKLQFTGGEKVNPIIEFMLEMILESIQNIKDDNVPINVPKNDPIKRDIAKLKEQNKIIRVGSLKSGHWEIKE